MSSNFPPGVSGNEWQIAGPDHEIDDTRECKSEGVTVKTITDFALLNLDHALEILSGFESKGKPLTSLHAVTAYIQAAKGDVLEGEIVGECPFVGVVTVTYYQGTETWECPVCRTLHENEVGK